MFGAVARDARVTPRVFDRKTDRLAAAAATWAEYGLAGVAGRASAAAALVGCTAAVSLVTADQALAAAEQAARHLPPGALWLDMNSVAPETKRAAARAIEDAGGRYVDVAVMSPVLPARAAVPLLLSGAHAMDARVVLETLGFLNSRIVPGDVGRASSIKMIRSVMIKGMEALTAECLAAAAAAGVVDEVLASLDATPPASAWCERVDYNLDRMMVHGVRRAAEMEEVVRTLDALGTGSVMSRGTTERQRETGHANLVPPPAGLAAKLAALGAKRGACAA